MTLLQAHLDSDRNRSSPRLPALSRTLFRQATNGVKNSLDNNHLLEWIGDRAVNLACALLVDKEKVCPDQQIFVGRKISNNDTLGRLAYWLELDTYAALDLDDVRAINIWSRDRKRRPPPKALANLFEAFSGAYFTEHGWDALLEWLDAVLRPLVNIATEDFFRCKRTPPHVSNWWRQTDGIYIKPSRYQRFLCRLAQQHESLVLAGNSAIEAIPLSAKFIFSGEGEIVNDLDRVEVAHHLLNQWIANTYVSLFPQYQGAISRAAYLATTITDLVISDVSLAYLASLFSLSSYFDVEDPDFNSGRPVRLELPADPTARARDAAYRTMLSLTFQAAVGWFHFHDPRAAAAWGPHFLAPIVTEAHDVLMQDASYRPIIPTRRKAAAPARPPLRRVNI